VGCGDGVYADGEFGDVGGPGGGGEEGENIGSGGGFEGGCYAVFEVVADSVYGEGAGFFEEFGGGGWDYEGLF